MTYLFPLVFEGIIIILLLHVSKSLALHTNVIYVVICEYIYTYVQLCFLYFDRYKTLHTFLQPEHSHFQNAAIGSVGKFTPFLFTTLC